MLETNVFSILKALYTTIYHQPSISVLVCACVPYSVWYHHFFGVETPGANFDTKNIHFRNYDKVITQNTNFLLHQERAERQLYTHHHAPHTKKKSIRVCANFT